MIDFIVVGLGVAGMAFCEQLEKYHKSYIVFEDNSQNASLVATGMCNPVVLRRFTPVWNANLHLETAVQLYHHLERKLHLSCITSPRLLRKFASVEEQNLWFEAADKSLLSSFISREIIKNQNSQLKAPYGFGEVLHTYKVNVKLLLERYRKFLTTTGAIRFEPFVYTDIYWGKKTLTYRGIKVKHIVFAEGYGLKLNPYFNHLPLYGNKGELLTIQIPGLEVDYILKSTGFIIPLNKDRYTLGATYHREDISKKTTVKAKKELLNKLHNFIYTEEVKVLSQKAGIRPTTKDRRPLLGRHHFYKNAYILNGLGTRGVMIAPAMAQHLYNFIIHQKPLPKEVDIARAI